MAFKLENIKTHEISSIAMKESDISFWQREIAFFGKSFNNKIKEDFYTELSVLLNAGVNLKNALELLENSQKKKLNKNILHQLLNDIISGQSLSDAIYSRSQFTDYEYYSLKIGEESGTLIKVTEQLSHFFARRNEQVRNIRSALTYPIIILSTAVLVLLFMLNYVVPMFQDIFKQQNIELPPITQFIITLSDFIKSYGWLLLLLLFFLPFLSRLILRNKTWYKRFKDNLMLRLPFIGGFAKTVYLSQFSQAVALLTASKIPMINSIQLVKQMINFHPLQNALKTVEASILKGESLSKSLGEHSLFGDKMVAMVKVAEETNQTEFIFERLNKQYNNQVQQQSKFLSTIMEPIIILIVGVLVGVILIAMYLPMFRLSSALG